MICKYLDEHMIRYYKTIAEVFASQPSFKADVEKTDGFCQEHYAKLLEYSSYAGGKREDYLNTLYTVQRARLEKLKDNLLRFCDNFDYRKIGEPAGEEKRSLKDYAETFYGLKQD